MSEQRFNTLVALYRALTFRENTRTGSLTIRDDAQLADISQLAQELDDYGLRVTQGDVDQLHVGQAIEFETSDPKLSMGIIAIDIDDLLIAPKARIKEPIRYFIIKENFCKADNNAPDILRRYHLTIKLIDLLRRSAAYLDEDAGELIFIDQGKFELPILYTEADLLNIDLEAANNLITIFSSDIHVEQKLAILAKSVRSVCSSAKPKQRFSAILEHLPELSKSVSEGYRLFVADFSYDKVVNQLEVAKLEEIGKIHKTFSDIQNQILGIPVATVIVATQMKHASDVGYEFWVNTAVLIGCWIFVVLSAFVLRNQLHTLTAIENEITRKKTQIINQYKAVEDLITQSFPFLEARLKTQRRAFIAVFAVLFVGLALSHVVYFFITDPAFIWISDIASKAYSALSIFLCLKA